MRDWPRTDLYPLTTVTTIHAPLKRPVSTGRYQFFDQTDGPAQWAHSEFKPTIKCACFQVNWEAKYNRISCNKLTNIMRVECNKRWC